MKKSSLIPAFLCFLLMNLYGESFADEQMSIINKGGEVSLGIGAVLSGGVGFAGVAIVGMYGFEASAVVQGNDAVFSGNFTLQFPNRKVIPFATAGLGVCIHEVAFFNVGGGIKIKLKSHFGVRADYQYYSAEDTKGGLVFGVISYYF